MTRDDVLALARSGDAWRGIPMCLQVLRVMPGDDEMRCQTAALFARLGLRTPALELLGTLPEAVQRVAAVESLRRMAERLGDDRIDAGARRETAERHLTILRVSDAVKAQWLGAWVLTLETRQFLRTNDGNVVVRDEAGEPTRCWIRFRNDRAEAEKFPLPHLAAEAKNAPPRGYTIEGLDPPFLFQRIVRETPPRADGYQPRVQVVQRDASEFLDGLSLIDEPEVFGSPRVHCYVGGDATGRLGEDLRARFAYQIVGPCITLATVRARCVPSAEETLGAAAAAQAAVDRELRARLAEVYSETALGDIRAAIVAAAKAGTAAVGAPGARPLRVLIPTCRYSTFIQHASSDLVDAFRGAGHDARLLIEEDAHSRFSSIAYLRAIEQLRPDVVVLINYTRSHLEGVMPPNLPFVSWMQDSMPHQFNAETGRRLGGTDYLIGHLHSELFTQFEYPEARRASMPMVVSTRKFHDEPVPARVARKHECELAYVSHHSETPEEMHARLMDEVGAGTLGARIFKGLEPRVRAIALASGTGLAHQELRRAAAEVIASVTMRDADERGLTQVTRQYCLPLADRIVRHQTLEWAVDVARRRGWRVNLYGRGWEQHPAFAPFARGELPHDEALRAAYQCAALHLHATINTPVHQRVMEGAASGGLVACRLNEDAVQCLRGAMYDAVIREAAPDEALSSAGRAAYPIADSPTAMSLLFQLQRLGAKTPVRESGCMYVTPATLARHRSSEYRLVREAVQLHELVGDLSEVTFRDAGELERLADRTVKDPAWRASRSRQIAERVRGSMTHDVLARRIVELVGAGGKY